jgi:DNA ligase (NAD+)
MNTSEPPLKKQDGTDTHAEDFKQNGITVLEKMSEKKLTDFLKELNKAYYNKQPLLSDNQYDIVKEFIEKKYPNNTVVREIGAQVEKNKVTLPYFMGSMDKIKPDTQALTHWTAKYTGPYVLSCKLDGISALYTTESTKPKLYTRGDGKIGQDISHLIPHLNLPKANCVVIRGELILPKLTFETKYKSLFANPRNMVAGLVNQKTISDAILDVHFVAYEVIQPVLQPSKQFELLRALEPNIETVLHKSSSVLNNEMLSATLVDWRQNYAYEIDGVIVSNDKIYERKTGNPDHAFAFKMVLSDQIAEAKVVDVIWQASKDGYLKPRVQIEPIRLGGVTIEYATGFNGAFIESNKIGVGSMIEMIRSGDVIPYIRKVVVPADAPKMPSVPYKWNNTHVDILLENMEDDDTVKEKNITGFFRGIEVDGLSSGNVKRIITAGYDTIAKILKMKVVDFLKVEGFKDKTATKLYEGIQQKISAASLITIMSASNMFGRGFNDKKIELILGGYPTVLISKDSPSTKIAKIAEIKGMAAKTSEAFVEKIPEFLAFLKETGLVEKLQEFIESTNAAATTATAAAAAAGPEPSHPLNGKTVVMTGFRDAVLQDNLKKVGATIGSSVSSKTFVLLVKDLNETSGKVMDANKHSVPLMTPTEFVKKYGLM